LGIGTKRVYPFRGRLAQKWELKATGGFMLPVSFQGRGTGYWFYGTGSVRIPRARTRLTVGPSLGTAQIFDRRAYSTTVCVQQPVSKRWSIASHWFTGTNDLGAGIWALSYPHDPRTLIIFGWKAANKARAANPAFMIEVARTFRQRKH
jgi:hypothetical protein